MCTTSDCVRDCVETSVTKSRAFSVARLIVHVGNRILSVEIILPVDIEQRGERADGIEPVRRALHIDDEIEYAVRF